MAFGIKPWPAYITELDSGLKWPAPGVDFIGRIRKPPSSSEITGDRAAKTAFFVSGQTCSARSDTRADPMTLPFRSGGCRYSGRWFRLSSTSTNIGMPTRGGHTTVTPGRWSPEGHPDRDRFQSHRVTLHPDQAGVLGSQAAHCLDDSVSARGAVNANCLTTSWCGRPIGPTATP